MTVPMANASEMVQQSRLWSKSLKKNSDLLQSLQHHLTQETQFMLLEKPTLPNHNTPVCEFPEHQQHSLTRQPTSTVFSWFLWVHLIASFTNCGFQHKKERKFRQPCSLGHCDSLSGRWHGVQKDSGPRSRPRWWSDGGCLPDSGPWSFSTGLSWAAASEEEEAGDVYTGLLSISLHVGETTTEIWITN